MEIQYTAPYTPQQNPTERANRTIKTMVAQYIKEKHMTWDELLPELNQAINSSVSDSTGFSPAFIVHCMEPRLPGALYDEVTPGDTNAARSPLDKAEMFRDVFKQVQDNTQRALQEQRKQYGLRRRAWKPTLGSLVFLRRHHLSKAVDNFAAKVAPKYEGPYKVVKFIAPTIVRLQQVNGRQRRTAALADLKEATYTRGTQELTQQRHDDHEDPVDTVE
ncbi:uncharacterized protein [Drosophila suzukii]|uniref:Integrase catalytic domain-containing protein n=1 Tax=Drosophila suzukii TaxID=28584 RepID=A0ABM4TYG6_DROSZ